MGREPEAQKVGASTVYGEAAAVLWTPGEGCRFGVPRGCGAVADGGRGAAAVGCSSVCLLVAVLQSFLALWTGGGMMGFTRSLTQHCLLPPHMKVALS